MIICLQLNNECKVSLRADCFYSECRDNLSFFCAYENSDKREGRRGNEE